MYCKDFLNLILGEKSGEYICVQGGYKDMEIKKPAMAGTLESSDCQVTVEPVSYTHLDYHEKNRNSSAIQTIFRQQS